MIGALAGGLTGGLGLGETVKAFTDGLGGNATVAVSYALLRSICRGADKDGASRCNGGSVCQTNWKKEDSRKKHCQKC